MKEHMKNVFSFHDSLKAFTDWLNSTEVSLCAFVYPSKLVDRVVKQMDEHEVSDGLVLFGQCVIMLVSVHDPAGRPSGEANGRARGE